MNNSIILFGGSYDPVHNGHIKIALEAKRELKAQKVLFIPSKRSPWKDNSNNADDRLNMLKLALEDYKEDGLEISDYEMKSEEDKDYTIFTARYFKKAYPEDVLYFLIGTDQLEKLDKWYMIDELSSLVKFVVYKRPGYEVNESNLVKYHGLLLNGEMMDISSTKIREGASFLMDKKVIDYIESSSLYYVNKVKENEKPRRYLHSVSVANLAYDIAVSNNLDPYKAYMAGYLHDITRMKSEPSDMKKAEEEFSKFFPKGEIPSYDYHQFTGPMFLKREFMVDDEEVLDAIRYHTTGKADMSPLGQVLYAADKIEPLRGYDSTKLIAYMKKDYKEGFKEVLSANKEFLTTLKDDKFLPDELTISCFNCYLKGE